MQRPVVPSGTFPTTALTGGWWVRIHFFSGVGDELYCDILGNAAVPAGAQEDSFWMQIPQLGDTTMQTNLGALGLSATMSFVVAYATVEFILLQPSGGSSHWQIDIDEVTFINQADPSTGQIAQRGSNSIIMFPAIAFTVTDTTFQPTLTFDMNRVDGSVTHVTDGSGTTVTGLVHSTNYKWYPYFNEFTKHVEHVMTGGVGTPAWLQAAATRDLFVEWYAQNHVPLAGSPIDVITLATGAPPGGGYGGGDNGCLRWDMYVPVRDRGAIHAEEVNAGDFVMGESGWLRVLAVEKKPHEHWAEIEFSNGGCLVTTLGHPFITVGERKLVRAEDLSLTTVLPWTQGVCCPTAIQLLREESMKVVISCESPHLFYAGGRKNRYILTHNLMVGRISTS